MNDRSAPDRRDHGSSLIALSPAHDLDDEVGRFVRFHNRTPVHTHRRPAVHYVLASSDFVRRAADGTIVLDTRTGGAPAAAAALWGSPLGPHSLENVGHGPLHVISVELKGLQLSRRNAPRRPGIE